MTLPEEEKLFPQLESLLDVYAAAYRMAEATDNEAQQWQLSYRARTLQDFLSAIKQGDYRTRPLF